MRRSFTRYPISPSSEYLLRDEVPSGPHPGIRERSQCIPTSHAPYSAGNCTQHDLALLGRRSVAFCVERAYGGAELESTSVVRGVYYTLYEPTGRRLAPAPCIASNRRASAFDSESPKAHQLEMILRRR